MLRLACSDQVVMRPSAPTQQMISDCNHSRVDFQMVKGSGAQGAILHVRLAHTYFCCKCMMGSEFPWDCITSGMRQRSDAFQAVDDRTTLKSQTTRELRSIPLAE